MSQELQMGTTTSDLIDDYNSLIYIINSEIKKINTADLVKVIAVNENNTIDVQPLLGNISANGSMNGTSPIYNIRYFQWRFGLNKIKAVPAVGDIGLLVCCKRDISNVENGNVGSFRRFSMADGIYIGGIEGLNPNPPNQIIEFSENALNITSSGTITVTAPTVNVNATTSATVTSPSVNLGGDGGAAVARVGDSVVNGKITTGSASVKAV